MKIIDCHAHVFPETIARKATDHVGDYYGVAMHGDGTANTLLSGTNGLEFTNFLIHSSATKAEQVHPVNDFIAGLVKENHKFIGFGTVHYQMQNPEEEIDRMISLGLKGIKVHPDFQGFNIDTPELFPVYRYAEGKLPILFHVGDRNSDASSPKRLRRVMDKFPDLTVIAAHMGGYSAWDEAMVYLAGTHAYFDTSSTLIELSAEKMLKILYAHGAEKILFGSDYPLMLPGDAAAEIMNLGLTQPELADIFYNNAAKLLRINEGDPT